MVYLKRSSLSLSLFSFEVPFPSEDLQLFFVDCCATKASFTDCWMLLELLTSFLSLIMRTSLEREGKGWRSQQKDRSIGRVIDFLSCCFRSRVYRDIGIVFLGRVLGKVKSKTLPVHPFI